MNNALFLRKSTHSSFAYSLAFCFVSIDEGRKGRGVGCAWDIYRLLADEEHIYGAEIEVIIEWKGCEAIVCRMLAGIELHGADNN